MGRTGGLEELVSLDTRYVIEVLEHGVRAGKVELPPVRGAGYEPIFIWVWSRANGRQAHLAGASEIVLWY